MAQVTLQGITKVYPGKIKAVDGFNLKIADGEFLVLVGPSGCGKSTTLRMIAGLEDITEGSITIGEKKVNNTPPRDRDIAMVFQNYALYPHMTVFKNMAFGLKLRKVKKKQIKEQVHQVAKTLGLTELLNRKPKALSGGQRQRVALGRAIIRNPQVFLFDEPLSNLDAQLRIQMRAEISQLHKRLKTTMIYVTHDQVEAMTMGDRIVVMLDGVIQQVATPTHLYTKPTNQFVAQFIGSPPINLLEGTIKEMDDERYFTSPGGIRLTFPDSISAQIDHYINKTVTIGIRPESLTHPEAGDRQDIPTIRGNIELVEPLGPETYLHISVGETTITARLKGDQPPPENNTPYTLDVDMTKIHLFDIDTQRAILD